MLISADSTPDWNKQPPWNEAVMLARQMVERRLFTSVSFQAFSSGTSPVVHTGLASIASEAAGKTPPLYLVASLTKPVIAETILRFAARGEFSLNERVCEFLPEWNRNEKRRITLRHLLSHTSGLPDQLPDNLEMRARGATLDEFYQAVVEVPLEFPPGTRAMYQSMGFVVLGRILEHLQQKPLREIIHEQIFAKLGMHDSYLGLPLEDESTPATLSRVIPLLLEPEQQAQAGNWNSPYWQTLGAPWGGLLSTPVDLLKFCTQTFYRSRTTGQGMAALLATEAMTNQLAFFEEMNLRDQKFRPWGLGWRLNWKTHRETFGDFLSETVVGHWGATGTLMWVDPLHEQACVICTNTPTAQSRAAIIRLSNAIHAALVSRM